MPRRSRIVLATGVAIVAVAMWVVWGTVVERRQERAIELLHAPDRYAEYARGYESGVTGSNQLFSACYGARWDGYTRKIYDDVLSHEGDKAYNARMADHFRRLTKKYEDAIKSGEPPAILDPPLEP